MIDTSRHATVFPLDRFGEREVHIIGVGAVGSAVALEMGSLGIRSIHLWDDDIVESHNLANQAFDTRHLGRPKVEAMADLLHEKCRYRPVTHREKYTSQPLRGIVFVLVDSMDTRKAIWERGIRLKPSVELMIEARMGAEEGRIYVVNPIQMDQIQRWEENWYPSEQAQRSACGASISVGATARVVAGLAAWQLIDWLDGKLGRRQGEGNFEILLNTRGAIVRTLGVSQLFV